MRSGRQVPSLYFGAPGKLFTLPWPKNGITKPYERQTSDFLTGSGNHQVSSLAPGTRAYDIKWDALHIDTFTKLEQYRMGANGPGPWVLIDPSAPNLLEGNVASATGLWGEPNFFTTLGGSSGTLVSQISSTYIHRTQGWASLKWTWAVTPATTPVLNIRPPSRNWFGYPVVVGLPYIFSSWVTVDGTVETNATVTLRMQWLNATGGVISTTSSSATAITTWTQLSATANAPAGAVYVNPFWELTGSTMVSGGSLFIDEPMLEQDSVINGWAAGSAIRPCEVVGLTEEVPFEARFRTGITMTLRELAP